MADKYYKIVKTTMQDIADAVRERRNITSKFKFAAVPALIAAIEGEPIDTKDATEYTDTTKRYHIQNDTLVSIANAIREREDSTDPILVSDFANRIRLIDTRNGFSKYIAKYALDIENLYGGKDSNSACTSNPSYGFVACGTGGSSAYVDCYDASLIKVTAPNLGLSRYNTAGGSVGNYALFGAGRIKTGTATGVFTSRLDYIDTSLVLGYNTSMLQMGAGMSSANTGDYCLMGGGYVLNSKRNGTVANLNMNAITNSFTKTVAPNLTITSSSTSAAANIKTNTFGNYAVFGGSSYSSDINVYDATLTKTVPTKLSTTYMSSTVAGDYIIYIKNATIDVYNKSFTKSTGPELSVSRYLFGGGSLGRFGLVVGGYSSSNSYEKVVDVYDDKLTRNVVDELTIGTQDSKSFKVGKYLVFTAGYSSSGSRNYHVEAYYLK